MRPERHIAFVTGTRAELGLMLRTLAAIRAHPRLRLSVIATGMHLDPRAGPRLSALRAAGITPAAIIPWPRHDAPAGVAHATGQATAGLARAFARLKVDGVLVVGDRVEAFAAATAAHLSRLPLAHVHGGDRAEGQLDDALRHAITKLAHLHLAATAESAARIGRLGEERATIHTVGAPGVERIRQEAAAGHARGDLSHTAIVLLHPTSPNPRAEAARALTVLIAVRQAGLDALLLLPNNDPGSQGIHEAWTTMAPIWPGMRLVGDLPRPEFLALLRDARVLVGNSSAGIIEAASFGLPVLDIGPRQSGRLHGRNVTHCDFGLEAISAGLARALRQPRASRGENPYARPGTAQAIARLLAGRSFAAARPKLITY